MFTLNGLNKQIKKHNWHLAYHNTIDLNTTPIHLVYLNKLYF